MILAYFELSVSLSFPHMHSHADTHTHTHTEHNSHVGHLEWYQIDREKSLYMDDIIQGGFSEPRQP